MTDKKFPEERQSLLFYHVDDSTEKAALAKHKVRRFWFVVVPIAGVASLVMSVVSGTNIFFPCWAVLAIVGGCWDQGSDSD